MYTHTHTHRAHTQTCTHAHTHTLPDDCWPRYIPFVSIALNTDELSLGSKVGASLMSTTALGIACQYAIHWEQVGVGLQWSNVFMGFSACDRFSFGAALLMMLVDGAVYLLLALYLEQVMPGEYGVPKSPVFCCEGSLGRLMRWLTSHCGGGGGGSGALHARTPLSVSAGDASLQSVSAGDGGEDDSSDGEGGDRDDEDADADEDLLRSARVSGVVIQNMTKVRKNVALCEG